MAGLNSKQVGYLSEPGRYLDADGLYLVVGASGGKSWLLRYQIGGKRRDMGFGPFPTVTLKAARLAATDARSLLMQGRDPLDERKAEQQRQKEQRQASKAKVATFQALAHDYQRTHCGHVTEEWRKGWLSKMSRYAFPLIGDLSPVQVDTEQVLRVLRPIWSDKPRTAGEVRGQLESVLDYAKALNLRPGENPARWRGHLDNLLSRADKKRASQSTNHPALPWRDLPAFMGRLAATTTRDACALRLVILTASRIGMVRFATWDEFDLEAAVWHLPAERMKTRQAFAVPLPAQAVELLRTMPRTVGSPYLFPGSGKSGVMSRVSFFKLLRAMGLADVTTHGFRATFRTWASECTHYPREVCELSLAHDERGKTEAAYSRSNLLEKRRQLVQDWADYATTPPAENVIHGTFGKVSA